MKLISLTDDLSLSLFPALRSMTQTMTCMSTSALLVFILIGHLSYKMKSGYVKLVGESIGMEKLNLTESSSNIVVDVSSNGTCISLTGNASEEDYQKLMSSATYFIMVADVATLPYPKRYVEYGIFDGVEPYSKANVTVNFVNIENPPVLLFSSSGGQSEVVERFYTAGDLFSLQDVADVLISDSDGSNMSKFGVFTGICVYLLN
eukprot:m.181708 g.181708  ORF g.181708 m.181708 type:complete len:205 (+) comp39278_c1_seq39:732-1346(+)